MDKKLTWEKSICIASPEEQSRRVGISASRTNSRAYVQTAGKREDFDSSPEPTGVDDIATETALV